MVLMGSLIDAGTGAGMAARRSPEELLQLEVRELTGLLRDADSFADLRDTLAAKGIPLPGPSSPG